MKVTRSPGDIAANLPDGAAVSVPVEILRAWQEELHNAFELGVKAAGGSIIPDRSNFVEVALDREQINALAQAAENIIVDDKHGHDADAVPALMRFLDIVSIHRSKR